MTRVEQNFDLYTGDDKILTFTIYDEDDVVVDLTNLAAAQWVMKKFSNTTTATLTKTLGSGIALVSATDGTISITIDSIDTEDLAPGEYYHEFRIKNSSNKLGTVATGKITLLPANDL